MFHRTPSVCEGVVGGGQMQWRSVVGGQWRSGGSLL